MSKQKKTKQPKPKSPRVTYPKVWYRTCTDTIDMSIVPCNLIEAKPGSTVVRLKHGRTVIVVCRPVTSLVGHDFWVNTKELLSPNFKYHLSFDAARRHLQQRLVGEFEAWMTPITNIVANLNRLKDKVKQLHEQACVDTKLTKTNKKLIKKLVSTKSIFIHGPAKGHTVKNTICQGNFTSRRAKSVKRP